MAGQTNKDGGKRREAIAFMSASSALGVGAVQGAVPHWCIWLAVGGLIVGAANLLPD